MGSTSVLVPSYLSFCSSCLDPSLVPTSPRWSHCSISIFSAYSHLTCMPDAPESPDYARGTTLTLTRSPSSRTCVKTKKNLSKRKNPQQTDFLLSLSSLWNSPTTLVYLLKSNALAWSSTLTTVWPSLLSTQGPRSIPAKWTSWLGWHLLLASSMSLSC